MVQLAAELRAASDRLVNTRQAVEELEAVWLEVDEQGETADRDAIAEQLEPAHSARDAAVDALCRIADEVVEAAAEFARARPAEASIPRKPRGRSIRLFRRKSAG